MKVVWSLAANRQLIDYLDYLAEHDERLSVRAKRDIVGRVSLLGRRPQTGRNARWPGLREFSLTRWRKLIVYRVEDGRVIVVAFYDARQDLSQAKPKPDQR